MRRLSLLLRRQHSAVPLPWQTLCSLEWTSAQDLPFKEALLSFLSFLDDRQRNRQHFQVDSVEQQVLLKTQTYFFSSLEGSSLSQVLLLLRLNQSLLQACTQLDPKSKAIASQSVLQFLRLDLLHLGDHLQDSGLAQQEEVMQVLA